MHEVTVGNFAVLYNRHDKVSDAYISLCSDKYLHWCTEDPKMEELRAKAEKALHEYAKAMVKLYRSEEKLSRNNCLKRNHYFKRLDH